MNIVNLKVTRDVLLPTCGQSSAPCIGDVGSELSPAGRRAIADRSIQPYMRSPESLLLVVLYCLARKRSKTLEKDPDLRCQTAAELRADLKRLSRDIESRQATDEDEEGAALSLLEAIAEASCIFRSRFFHSSPVVRPEERSFLKLVECLA